MLDSNQRKEMTNFPEVSILQMARVSQLSCSAISNLPTRIWSAALNAELMGRLKYTTYSVDVKEKRRKLSGR